MPLIIKPTLKKTNIKIYLELNHVDFALFCYNLYIKC